MSKPVLVSVLSAEFIDRLAAMIDRMDPRREISYVCMSCRDTGFVVSEFPSAMTGSKITTASACPSCSYGEARSRGQAERQAAAPQANAGRERNRVDWLAGDTHDAE